jgi:hypothetical protein
VFHRPTRRRVLYSHSIEWYDHCSRPSRPIPYVYICGVGAGAKAELRHQNLHLPLRYKEGGIVEKPTYNGYIFRAENAEELPIPALPDDWMGSSASTRAARTSSSLSRTLPHNHGRRATLLHRASFESDPRKAAANVRSR